MNKTMRVLVTLVALLALASPAAQAASRDKIIADCSDDGVLQGSYSASDLRDARKHLPSDVAEYTDCADVLRRAELPSNGGSGSPGSGSGAPSTGGSTPPTTGGAVPSAPPVLKPETPQDTEALVQSRKAPEQPVTVGGENLLAGAAPLREGYRANGLPDSLIVALILLGVAGIALSVPPLRRRLPHLSFPRPRRS